MLKAKKKKTLSPSVTGITLLVLKDVTTEGTFPFAH